MPLLIELNVRHRLWQSWKALDGASPSTEVSPSLRQAASVGAVTPIQSGTELTQDASGFLRLRLPLVFPPHQDAVLQGSWMSAWGVYKGPSFWWVRTQFYHLLHYGTAEKSLETSTCCLPSFLVTCPMQLRYGQVPRGRNPQCLPFFFLRSWLLKYWLVCKSDPRFRFPSPTSVLKSWGLLCLLVGVLPIEWCSLTEGGFRFSKFSEGKCSKDCWILLSEHPYSPDSSTLMSWIQKKFPDVFKQKFIFLLYRFLVLFFSSWYNTTATSYFITAIAGSGNYSHTIFKFIS